MAGESGIKITSPCHGPGICYSRRGGLENAWQRTPARRPSAVVLGGVYTKLRCGDGWKGQALPDSRLVFVGGNVSEIWDFDLDRGGFSLVGRNISANNSMGVIVAEEGEERWVLHNEPGYKRLLRVHASQMTETDVFGYVKAATRVAPCALWNVSGLPSLGQIPSRRLPMLEEPIPILAELGDYAVLLLSQSPLQTAFYSRHCVLETMDTYPSAAPTQGVEGTPLSGIEETMTRLFFAWMIEEIREQVSDSSKLIEVDHPSGDPYRCALSLDQLVQFAISRIAYGALPLERAPNIYMRASSIAGEPRAFVVGADYFEDALLDPWYGFGVFVHELHHFEYIRCLALTSVFDPGLLITYNLESSALLTQGEYLSQTKEMASSLPVVAQSLRQRASDLQQAYQNRDQAGVWPDIVQKTNSWIDFELATALESALSTLMSHTFVAEGAELIDLTPNVDVWNATVTQASQAIPNISSIEATLWNASLAQVPSPEQKQAWVSLDTFVPRAQTLVETLKILSDSDPQNQQAYDLQTFLSLNAALEQARALIQSLEVRTGFRAWINGSTGAEQLGLAAHRRQRS